LGVPIEENAGCVRIDPDQFFADAVGAVHTAKKLLEFVVGNGLLEPLQRLPIRAIGEGIAGVFGRDKRSAEE
jgi:hypothetical protein